MCACPHATVEIFGTNNKGGGKEVEGRDGERERGGARDQGGKREVRNTPSSAAPYWRRRVALPTRDSRTRSEGEFSACNYGDFPLRECTHETS